MEFTSIMLLSVFFATLLYWYTSYARYWISRGIPSLTPLPLIGNFKDYIMMKQSPGEFMVSIYKRATGPVLGIFVFNKPALFIRDPAWIKQILVKDFNMFQDRVSSTDGHNDVLGSMNLFRVKNPMWKEMRAKLTPIFTTGKMKSMLPLMKEVGSELNNYLYDMTNRHKNVENARDISAKYTTDVIATCAFGIKANSLKNHDAEFREIGRRIFAPSWRRVVEISTFFFFPEIVAMFGFKLFGESATKFLRSTFNETMKARLSRGTRRHDLVDLLLALKDTETVPGELKFEGDTLVAQAAVFFAAGFEASSGTMSFTLYELALQPDLQNRLRSEIQSKIEEHGDITYEAIKEMQYLDMVICETLRKYPTLPFLDRMCSKPSAGYRLPAPYDRVVLEPGTPVYLSVLAVHMDPVYYPDPDKYDPERFTEEAKQLREPYTFLPFGAGPHSCIGERFGMLQTKVGLVYVLKDFVVSPCAETNIPLQFAPKALFLAPKGGIKLNFEKI